MGASILPVSNEYWDFETQQWVDAASDRRVGNTTGGSWHGVVSSFSDAPDATYSFLALMAANPVSKCLCTSCFAGFYSGYSYHLSVPLGASKLEDSTS